jgi:membrane protein implicated in regulation of membrane protease activity
VAETSPQQTIQELKDLVVAYFKQETVDPIKGLGRYLAFGVLGALMLGGGVFFLAMGGLRALQSETGTTFTGNWSWAPYGIVVVALLGAAGVAWKAGSRRGDKTGDRSETR